MFEAILHYSKDTCILDLGEVLIVTNLVGVEVTGHPYTLKPRAQDDSLQVIPRQNEYLHLFKKLIQFRTYSLVYSKVKFADVFI